MNARSIMGAWSHLWAGLLTLMLLATVSPASGQGFMVKPMRMDVTAPAGKSVEIPLEIRNTGGSNVRAIELRLVEISQNIDGTWRIIEPGSAEKAPAPTSATSWTSLAESRVEIEPMAPAEIKVRVNAPADARGAYFTGIVAETPLPKDINGVVVRVRFVIPLIIEIEGRPARQQVALKDVLMTYQDASGGKKPSTTAALRITNDGRTYSHLKGQLSVERKTGDRWRLVTRFDVPERSIIPGMTLELGKDLERRLPSGTYRLRGRLSVDGRRVAPVEKEIDFKGDPAADSLAYDTALILEPDAVKMNIVPGATRTTTLRIENPGTDPVKVHMSSKTPAGLAGVAMGKLLGSSFSAEPWTQIMPSDFTIRPGTRQNVRVMTRVPREGVDHPHYYADLVLSGAYADGQSAGETRSTIELLNPTEVSNPAGSVEQISLSEGGEPNQYFVQARFVNIGNVHLEPTLRAFLLSPQGAQKRNIELTGEEGMLLPLNKRNYSAELNLKGIDPGFYALRVVATLAEDKQVKSQLPIRIENEQVTGADGKSELVSRVTVVDPATAELPKDLGTQMENEESATPSGEKEKSAGTAG